MILAEQDPDPENFWIALTVLTSLLTGFLGGWATLRAANPRRQLAYWMPAATRLLHTSDVVGDLVVTRGGQTLRHPHVLDVRLMNRGRRDVASSHFDNGMPIRLDVGAPIVEILGVTSEPDSLHTPTSAVEGTAVTITPSLIAKGQTICFSVLADGPTPRLTCQASLIDVTVQERRDPNRQHGRDISTGIAIGASFGLAGVVFLLYLTTFVSLGPVEELFELSIPLITLLAGGAFLMWLRRRRPTRRPDPR
ncbi:hypothetical protein ACH4SP_27525 [Streptomyces sp. NPDC021093]|uniref:hypothetical protein n=1 Tax=Streptomyces sp. NPDC021093 TaxID=3365112 RepID=UPI00378B93AB